MVAQEVPTSRACREGMKYASNAFRFVSSFSQGKAETRKSQTGLDRADSKGNPESNAQQCYRLLLDKKDDRRRRRRRSKANEVE